MQPNKILLLVSMKTQSTVSICMAHAHIYLSEARQLHHDRFRHIKPKLPVKRKGETREFQGEAGRDWLRHWDVYKLLWANIFLLAVSSFHLGFFLAIWLVTVFSLCFSKSSLLQVLISFYTKTCRSRSDVLLNTHQDLWPKPLTYCIYNRWRRLIHPSHSCSY